jgi:hypothetical protein
MKPTKIYLGVTKEGWAVVAGFSPIKCTSPARCVGPVTIREPLKPRAGAKKMSNKR